MRPSARQHFLSYKYIDLESKILYDNKIKWQSKPRAIRVWILTYSHDKNINDIITSAVYNDSHKTLKTLNKYILNEYINKLNHYFEKKALLGEQKLEVIDIVGMVPLKVNPSTLYKDQD